MYDDLISHFVVNHEFVSWRNNTGVIFLCEAAGEMRKLLGGIFDE
jgi:hypothetical protein